MENVNWVSASSKKPIDCQLVLIMIVERKYLHLGIPFCACAEGFLSDGIWYTFDISKNNMSTSAPLKPYNFLVTHWAKLPPLPEFNRDEEDCIFC